MSRAWRESGSAERLAIDDTSRYKAELDGLYKGPSNPRDSRQAYKSFELGRYESTLDVEDEGLVGHA